MELSPKSAAFTQEALENYLSTCPAIPRFLGACNPVPASWLCDQRPAKLRANSGWEERYTPKNTVRSRLTDLAHVGPYVAIACYLDLRSLSRLDETCNFLGDVNRGCCGPWFTLGLNEFRGIEVVDERPIRFDFGIVDDWKERVAYFRSEVLKFREPFAETEITNVEYADEVGFCRSMLRTDVLMQQHAAGAGGDVWIEFQVVSNPDRVSLAVFDFEAGGCSSVTFSPDAGAIIREKKVEESPRRVEGTYFQPLTHINGAQCFEGYVGLFFSGGHIAFFRKQAIASDSAASAGDEAVEYGPWESTGFVTDLSWAEGCQLTPCFAFGRPGAYNVKMQSVNATPPFIPEKNSKAYETGSWTRLDWFAADGLEEPEFLP